MSPESTAGMRRRGEFATLAVLLDPAEAAGRVRRALPCFARDELALEHVSPERLDVGSDGLTLSLAAHVMDPRTRRRAIRRVFARTGEAATAIPTTRWAGVDERRSLVFWMSPADPQMPGIETALAASTLRELLTRAGVDPAPAAPLRTGVLAHRFGRRITVRIREEGTRRSWLLKIGKRDDAVRTAAVLDLFAARRRGPRVPRLLHRDGAILLLEWIPGTSLHARAATEPMATLESVGAAVRDIAVVPPPGITAHRAADEVEVARRLAARAAIVDAGLAEAIGGAAEEREAEARSLDTAPLVLVHRDLHDKQVILARGRPAIIDWDLAAAAPAELDVGNFLAHLRLRTLQGRLAADRAMAWRRRFLAGWAGSRPDVPADALRICEALALVRLAAVYALRPAWPGLAAALLETAGPRRTRS